MPICFRMSPLSDCSLSHQDYPTLGFIQLTVGRALFPNLIYIVYDSKSSDAVVVDPGWESDFLCEVMAGRGLTLRGIAVTHSHVDHTAHVSRLSAATGAQVYASLGCMQTLDIPPARQHILIEDTVIRSGSLDLQVLMTPGHTSCSVCFLIGESLFPGDTLFMEGCGLATAPGGDAADLYRSCAKLKAHVPDWARVWPAHQYTRPVGATFVELKASNFYLRLSTEDNFVAFCSRRRGRRAPPPVGTVSEQATEVRDLPPLSSHIKLKDTD